MKMLGTILAAGWIAIAAAPAEAWWDETLTREGSYWVQTVTGAESVAVAGKLRVSTRGRVAVTGSAEEQQVRFTFTKKVKARGEADARRMLGQLVVKGYRQGDTSTISVGHGGDAVVNTELMVKAPRGLRDIYAETYGGSVEATDLNGSIQAHTSGGRIRLDRIGGQVVARTAGGEIVLGTIGDSVRCISAGGPIRAGSIKGEARFETAGGDIIVGDVTGPLHASTAGGAIQVGKADAVVTVHTAGGGIEVGAAKGMVTAESSGGPIRVGAAAGVRCETGSGAIRLSNVTGRLQASTAVGNIIANLLAGPPGGDGFLTTGAGDITIFVPSNLGITIQAQNERAYSVKRIVSEFPAVTVESQGSRVIAAGAINGGGPVLRLSSAGGTIYIRKQQ